MVRITTELLRKRAEHNEGCLSTLEEITLHQQDLESIELVGETCRGLRILYLQNNLIGKIQNLHHLKKLEYLNLGINNITRIENLESCESLKKLDLMLNFIKDLTSVDSLRSNPYLRQLYLTGNDCVKIPGYRFYVIDTLPQLEQLDGIDISRSERILAKQEAIPVREEVMRQKEAVRLAEEEEQRRREAGIVVERKVDEKGETLYAHTPEDRLASYRDLQKMTEEKKKKPVSEYDKLANPEPRVILTGQQEIEKYGKILQKNQAQLQTDWTDSVDAKKHPCKRLEIHVPKYLSNDLIEVDVEPTWINVVVKGKIIRLVIPDGVEVQTSGTKVERARVNGHLLITMPIATSSLEKAKKCRGADKTPPDVEKAATNDADVDPTGRKYGGFLE